MLSVLLHHITTSSSLLYSLTHSLLLLCGSAIPPHIVVPFVYRITLHHPPLYDFFCSGFAVGSQRPLLLLVVCHPIYCMEHSVIDTVGYCLLLIITTPSLIHHYSLSMLLYDVVVCLWHSHSSHALTTHSIYYIHTTHSRIHHSLCYIDGASTCACHTHVIVVHYIPSLIITILCTGCCCCVFHRTTAVLIRISISLHHSPLYDLFCSGFAVGSQRPLLLLVVWSTVCWCGPSYYCVV